MRQSAISCAGAPSVAVRNSPRTVLLLPTSSASSMERLPASSGLWCYSCLRFWGLADSAGKDRATNAIVGVDEQEAALVETCGYASISALLGDVNALAADPCGGLSEALDQ